VAGVTRSKSQPNGVVATITDTSRTKSEGGIHNKAAGALFSGDKLKTTSRSSGLIKLEMEDGRFHFHPISHFPDPPKYFDKGNNKKVKQKVKSKKKKKKHKDKKGNESGRKKQQKIESRLIRQEEERILREQEKILNLTNSPKRGRYLK